MGKRSASAADGAQTIEEREAGLPVLDGRRGHSLRRRGRRMVERLLTANHRAGSILLGSWRVVLTIGVLGVDQPLPDLIVQLITVIQVQAFEQIKANALPL